MEIDMCPICYEKYNINDTIIQILPKCNHRICTNCFKKIINISSMSISCPLCRDVSFMKNSTILDNFANGTEMMNYLLHSKCHTRINRDMCDKCQNVQIIYGCSDCEIKLCEKCWPEIHSIGRLVHHQKVDMEEYNLKGKCPSHPKYQKELVCISKCSHQGDLICLMCEKTPPYKLCRTDYITNIAKKQREELLDKITILKEKIEMICNDIVRLNQNNLESINLLTDETIKQITDHFKKIHEKIYEYESYLIDNVKSKMSDQYAHYLHQKNELCNYTLENTQLIHETENHIINSSDLMIVTKYKMLVDQLTNMINKPLELEKEIVYPINIICNDIELDNICRIDISNSKNSS